MNSSRVHIAHMHARCSLENARKSRTGNINRVWSFGCGAYKCSWNYLWLCIFHLWFTCTQRIQPVVHQSYMQSNGDLLPISWQLAIWTDFGGCMRLGWNFHPLITARLMKLSGSNSRLSDWIELGSTSACHPTTDALIHPNLWGQTSPVIVCSSY